MHLKVSGPSWQKSLADLHHLYHPKEPNTLYIAIQESAKVYWKDPERHRRGRLNLFDARQHIVLNALKTLDIGDPTLAYSLTARYTAIRTARTHLVLGALDTLLSLRNQGVRLALITNGETSGQREKIRRFELAPFFQSICIEEECGFGKPDPRVFRQALKEIDVMPEEAWMVGDNLEWDVLAAQKLGIRGIWVDYQETGLPANVEHPYRIITVLPEILRI